MIGESWELADLPEAIEGGRSVIANGVLRGRTLHDAMVLHREAIMGRAHLSDVGGFPLLIKFLDARENLSVQVHPTKSFAATHPGAHLKAEAWYILDAEPGAVIYRGIRPGVTRDVLQAHLARGLVAQDLLAIPARPGACHYLPSGTCHALGAGILVAEVQTPSDTTFRLYDWGRTGRALHIDEAMECIDFSGSSGERAYRSQPIEVDGMRTERLVETDSFEMERIDAEDSQPLELVTDAQPIVIVMTDGRGRLTGGGETVELRAGTTALVPAASDDALLEFERGAKVLRITPPSPIRGMLA